MIKKTFGVRVTSGIGKRRAEPARQRERKMNGMFFVPDNTEKCGFYECRECGARFLDLRIAPTLVCPYCGEESFDMEIGPDDEMPEVREDAALVEMIVGEEEVERYDGLLSLAITGGDYEWL